MCAKGIFFGNTRAAHQGSPMPNVSGQYAIIFRIYRYIRQTILFIFY